MSPAREVLGAVPVLAECYRCGTAIRMVSSGWVADNGESFCSAGENSFDRHEPSPRDGTSRPCLAKAHATCDNWDSCGCYCHQVCPRCLNRCRVLYQLNDADMCAACYKELLPTTRPGCEECGASRAYREPRAFHDDRFLCYGCHEAAGHPMPRGVTW